jgi:ABC-type multidrug transport system ATPase subunit
MMTISLSEVSKRFNREWIFRKFSYSFTSYHSYAITGPNGSGKSTLLQVIGGAIAMSEGVITYEVDCKSRESGVSSAESEQVKGPDKSIQPSTPNIQNKKPPESMVIAPDHAFKYISIAAPYLELIEEMTATEFLNFHRKFKPLLIGSTVQKVISIVGLENAAHKQIRYYSSGMKQRIKLAQAIFSNTPVVLLDEPCTNLDTDGIRLYQRLINEYCKQRLVIVSSNDMQEYSFCEETISILDYK